MERTAKTLIRLGGYPGWSDSSLSTQAMLFVLSCCGSCVLILSFQNEYTMFYKQSDRRTFSLALLNSCLFVRLSEARMVDSLQMCFGGIGKKVIVRHATPKSDGRLVTFSYGILLSSAKRHWKTRDVLQSLKLPVVLFYLQVGLRLALVLALR